MHYSKTAKSPEGIKGFRLLQIPVEKGLFPIFECHFRVYKIILKGKSKQEARNNSEHRQVDISNDEIPNLMRNLCQFGNQNHQLNDDF